MLPTEGQDERRHARSDDPLLSLSRLFEAARRCAGARTLVLADDMGLSIAGAGPASACDELAALALARESRRAANDTVPCRLEVLARTLEVRRLRIDGIEVYLCAEGGNGAREAALDGAVAGAERILGRRKRR